MTLNQIKNELSNLDIEELQKHIELYKEDKRIGVQKLLNQYQKKIEDYKKELQRINNLCQFENKEYKLGKTYIGGIDEVGRGPLAGPVVACTAVLPKNCTILGINDSKKLSSTKREQLYKQIKNQALSIGIGIIDVDIIDKINILNATYKAMQQAVSQLSLIPDTLLVDELPSQIPNINIKQILIVKGDAKSISIGAASIIAKVTRDNMMNEYDKLYPEYKFNKNKGYGTAEHIDAIKKFGLCPIHRKTFVKNFIEEGD